MVLMMIATYLFVAINTLQPGARPSQQKEVRSEPINTTFKAPPDTLAEMIIQADLVVRGRIVGASPRDYAVKGGGGTIANTAYHLKVEEILHADDSKAVNAPTIDIVRPGGERDHGTYIERSYQVGFPPFTAGSDYVFFLVWNPSFSAWVPAFGPDSAFELVSGGVASAGKASVTKSLTGKSAADFVDQVRRFGG